MITYNSVYTKEFKYTNPDGSQGSLMIKPVPGKDLKLLFAVARQLQGADKNPDKIIEKLDEDTVDKLVRLCLSTLEVSCPEAEPSLREQFAVSHFNELVSIIFEVNIRG